ncbi:polysaccharide deacetylase family protein [Acuticoccus kandeliae]|uniref:polysaccharide deacetylase family protein n=1 Tax=Acuticoccus kandeliae TaxID=2073160 RepID=UPI000D3EC7AD|nr:polysaccharide deacetylase family protein [Acuticoccus kandeliae]
MTAHDRRNFIGESTNPPAVTWPGGAPVAVSIVVNVEEGAELSVGDGDARNETVHEINEDIGLVPDLCMESHFGYGPRAGFPRLLALFAKHGVRASFSACGRSVARSPWMARMAVEAGHEVSCHSYLWERHAGMAEDQERAIIAKTHAAITEAAGVAPVGWHTRSSSTPNTRRLLVEHGGFLYDSDAYDDDMPYYVPVAGRPHLVMPYAFDTNDMRFSPGGGFIHGEDFARYTIAAYDWLEREGETMPRMMSIGLHLRFIGRPGRIGGLDAILDHITRRGAFIAPRMEIARHWIEATR